MVGRGNDRDGFTIAELMVAIGIAGILMSIAIPNFGQYLFKAKFAEAHGHLATMMTGMKAYYTTDHYTQGVSSGAQAASTNCVVASARTNNNPGSQRYVLDWDAEEKSFEDINFTPADPMLHNYAVGIVLVAGQSTYVSGGPNVRVNGWTLGGGCGNWANNTGGNYQIEAKGNPRDGDTVYSLSMNMCTNAENLLYKCGERFGPTIPTCSAVTNSGQPAKVAVWALLIFGLVQRRRRR